MSCPVCKSDQFYIKDLDDEYETYDFQLQDGQVTFDEPNDENQTTGLKQDRRIFCQRCAWNGHLKEIS